MTRSADEPGAAILVVEAALNPARFSRSSMIIRGIFAVVIGLLLTVSPGESAAGIVMGIGFLLILDAAVLLVAAFSAKGRLRTACIVYGILIFLTGAIAFTSPILTGVVWTILIGIWQLVAGIHLLADDLPISRGWARFSGGMAVLTGFLFIVWPAASFLAFAWVGGLLLLVTGASLLIAPLLKPKN